MISRLNVQGSQTQCGAVLGFGIRGPAQILVEISKLHIGVRVDWPLLDRSLEEIDGFRVAFLLGPQ